MYQIIVDPEFKALIRRCQQRSAPNLRQTFWRTVAVTRWWCGCSLRQSLAHTGSLRARRKQDAIWCQRMTCGTAAIASTTRRRKSTF